MLSSPGVGEEEERTVRGTNLFLKQPHLTIDFYTQIFINRYINISMNLYIFLLPHEWYEYISVDSHLPLYIRPSCFFSSKCTLGAVHSLLSSFNNPPQDLNSKLNLFRKQILNKLSGVQDL